MSAESFVSDVENSCFVGSEAGPDFTSVLVWREDEREEFLFLIVAFKGKREGYVMGVHVEKENGLNTLHLYGLVTACGCIKGLAPFGLRDRREISNALPKRASDDVVKRLF